LAELVADGLPT